MKYINYIINIKFNMICPILQFHCLKKYVVSEKDAGIKGGRKQNYIKY